MTTIIKINVEHHDSDGRQKVGRLDVDRTWRGNVNQAYDWAEEIILAFVKSYNMEIEEGDVFSPESTVSGGYSRSYENDGDMQIEPDTTCILKLRDSQFTADVTMDVFDL